MLNCIVFRWGFKQLYAYIISIISSIAVLNGVLAQVIMGSRVLYGLAGQDSTPKLFHQVHKRFQTPKLATIVISIGIAVLAIFFPIVQLANATSYVIISVFVLVNLSQTKLAFTDFGKKKCWGPGSFSCHSWLRCSASFFLGIRFWQKYSERDKICYLSAKSLLAL